MQEFELTEEHLKLLRAMFVVWEDDGETGAPAIDSKKPYGDSYVELDIAEILDWGQECLDNGLNDEQLEDAIELHSETVTALQIFLQHATLEPGTYTADKYSSKWRKDDN